MHNCRIVVEHVHFQIRYLLRIRRSLARFDIFNILLLGALGTVGIDEHDVVRFQLPYSCAITLLDDSRPVIFERF